jgi:hypothetical protein
MNKKTDGQSGQWNQRIVFFSNFFFYDFVILFFFFLFPSWHFGTLHRVEGKNAGQKGTRICWRSSVSHLEGKDSNGMTTKSSILFMSTTHLHPLFQV